MDHNLIFYGCKTDNLEAGKENVLSCMKTKTEEQVHFYQDIGKYASHLEEQVEGTQHYQNGLDPLNVGPQQTLKKEIFPPG